MNRSYRYSLYNSLNSDHSLPKKTILNFHFFFSKKEDHKKSTELAKIQSESVFPKYELENEELLLRNCDGIKMPKYSDFSAGTC